MLTVRTVLCPVDFSERSRQALRWAAAIAQRRGDEMTVLSVVEPLLAQAAGIRLGVDLAREETEPELREFVEATLPEHQRQASHLRMEVTVGNASEMILATGRRLNAGLIVMGTHGLGGIRKLLLGSTAEQVLRRTESAVLVVPRGAVPPPAVADPGVHVKRILLATDFRESAKAATRWAADLASDIGVPLVFAHVVNPVEVPPRWGSLAAEFESDRVASGQRMIGKLAASVDQPHSQSVVSVGDPADTIASLVSEYGVGLVVMGLGNAEDSEQRRPGSIAYRVLRLADVAVVVVPAQAAAGMSLTRTPTGIAANRSKSLSSSRIGHQS